MNLKTKHQQRVEQFMRQARQAVPDLPELPDAATRQLRARLIWEEALETIEGLGYIPQLGDKPITKDNKEVWFYATGNENLIKVVDGCADLSVVNVGTLSACGVSDKPVLREVDANNLAKFGPGHSFRADGKLKKPPDHKPPDFAFVLSELGWDGDGAG